MNVRISDLKKHPIEKGWHSKVSNPYLFIDGCMQIWPDADFAALKDYGVSAYCVTAFRPLHPGEAALDGMADWWRVARTYPRRCGSRSRPPTSSRRSKHGQAALVLTAQGGDFLGQNLNRLEMFHKMGLRVMLPCYNTRNPLGDGLMEPENSGLSNHGQALGRRMQPPRHRHRPHPYGHQVVHGGDRPQQAPGAVLALEPPQPSSRTVATSPTSRCAPARRPAAWSASPISARCTSGTT